MRSHTIYRENVRRIVRSLGGPTHAAEILGVAPTTVRKWLERGIPDSRAEEIAQILRIDLGLVPTYSKMFPGGIRKAEEAGAA